MYLFLTLAVLRLRKTYVASSATFNACQTGRGTGVLLTADVQTHGTTTSDLMKTETFEFLADKIILAQTTAHVG